ncbi:ABC transporter substrate-binding protein [Pseudonocardia nematodicida]|uniref:ABC transporter substrate-binding protein n=1 Tax=Pseudonocardia nematodicida TaxID=1206997 RepID=A0ABV1K5P0_9PSEU
MRKVWLASAALLVFGVAGCGSAGGGSNAADDVIRIGFIAPTQGAFGEIGENLVDGARIAVDQANAAGGIDGRQLELVVTDEGTSPQTATQAARDLVGDGVELVGGMFSSANCGAVAPIIEQSPAVLITGSCASNEQTGAFTGQAPFTRTFGVAARDRSTADAVAEVIGQRFPQVRTFDVLGFDYKWGRETWDGFRDGLDGGAGITVNREQWLPLNTTDFRAQVSAMSRGLAGERDGRGVFLSTYGAGTAGFIQQAESFDLPQQIAVLANAGEYYNVARSLNGRAPDMWNAYDYNYAAFDTPVNQEFVEAYGAMHDGARPVGWTYQGYLVGLAYTAALQEAGTDDPEQVRTALEGVTFDGPSGPVTIGAESHQADIPTVVSHTVGAPDQPDGIDVVETIVVPYGGR